MKRTRIYAMLAILMLIVSCEKYNLDEAKNKMTENEDTEGNVALYLDSCQQDRITVALFQDGKKIKTIHKSLVSSPTNQMKLTLPEGNYQLLVVAYNSEDNCTISSTQKITFPNNKITETSYILDSLKVADEDVSKNLRLRKVTGTFMLHITDSIPPDAYQLKFYYTGGSSTLDAHTGYGCVNSRQTEYRDIRSNLLDYCVYTFPHQEKKKLKMTITALDESGASIQSDTLAEIPIQVADTTLYRTDFFKTSPGANSSNSDFNFTFDEKWKDSIDVPFFHKAR